MGNSEIQMKPTGCACKHRVIIAGHKRGGGGRSQMRLLQTATSRQRWLAPPCANEGCCSIATSRAWFGKRQSGAWLGNRETKCDARIEPFLSKRCLNHFDEHFECFPYVCPEPVLVK
eukprot:COSAG06_NODE_4165_length_4508_cov_8.097026_3_plen_117_part_00